VEKHYDENDTVTDSEFYQTPDLDEDEQDALDKAAQHDDTPKNRCWIIKAGPSSSSRSKTIGDF